MCLLKFFKKLLFAFNILFGILLLLSCFVPYIPTDTVPIVAFFSLSIPVLVLVNTLFLLFWLLLRKRQLWFSFVILVISYFSLTSFFMFRFSDTNVNDEDLKIMSYNVRGFYGINHNKPNVDFVKIKNLITEENPDIICFQEFRHTKRKEFKDYKYSYTEFTNNPGKVKLGIYSKYPILSKGLLDFPGTSNDGAFVDVAYNNDTIRVYNLHLQSLHVVPNPEVLAREESSKLYTRLVKTFKKQQEQAQIVLEHRKTTNYKTLVCGDFNSTQFSNVFKTIKGDDLVDTFQEKGAGYGRTYNFEYYPVRIDFILSDTDFEIVSHKNYNEKLSDHFPVMASLRLKTH